MQALAQLRSEWAAASLVSWLGLRDTLRRAGAIVRRRWGEGMAGAGNLTLVAGLAGAIFGLVVAVASFVAAPDEAALTAVFLTSITAFFLLVAAVGAAGQVLALALYRHAVGRGPLPPFTDVDLEHALVARRRLPGRRPRSS